MITMDSKYLTNGAPDNDIILAVLKVREKERERLARLQSIYEGKHDILARERLPGVPNHRLMHDIPGYIVTIASGYLVGSPVQYDPQASDKTAFEAITDALKAANSESVDSELAVDASIFGRGVELCYADRLSRPRVAQVSPLHAFVVYDDTVEHTPLFGVMITPLTDKTLKAVLGTNRVTIYTGKEIRTYTETNGQLVDEGEGVAHYFGGVPMVEYWNNSRETGDFERIMHLIDAYNLLQSDRLNDKQQFTDAMLALYGIYGLGVDDGEAPLVPPLPQPIDQDSGEVGVFDPDTVPDAPKPAPTRAMHLTAVEKLRESKILYMPAEGASAEWLTKPPVQSDSEVLLRALRSDIHKLSLVPDMSDEKFAGNSSGVAMKYKLLGLEELTKIKERWFKEGLRSRLRLFAAFLAASGEKAIDADSVTITLKRSLPVNELEIAQMVRTLDGIVPDKILLSQIPFVDDAEEALRQLDKDNAAAQEAAKKALEDQVYTANRQPLAQSGGGNA